MKRPFTFVLSTSRPVSDVQRRSSLVSWSESSLTLLLSSMFITSRMDACRADVNNFYCVRKSAASLCPFLCRNLDGRSCYRCRMEKSAEDVKHGFWIRLNSFMYEILAVLCIKEHVIYIYMFMFGWKRRSKTADSKKDFDSADKEVFLNAIFAKCGVFHDC